MEDPHRILEPTSATSRTEDVAREKRPCTTVPEVQMPTSNVTEPLPPVEDRTLTLSLQEVSLRLKAFYDAYEESRRSKEDPTLVITLGEDAILKAIKNAVEGNIQANEEIIEDVRQVRIAYEQGLDLEELEQQLKEAAEESRTVTQQIEEECQTIKINIGPVIEPMHAKADTLEGEVIKQASEHDTYKGDQPTENVKTEVAPHAAERREGPDDITSQAEDVIHGIEGQPASPPAECQEEPDDITRQAEDVIHQIASDGLHASEDPSDDDLCYFADDDDDDDDADDDSDSASASASVSVSDSGSDSDSDSDSVSDSVSDSDSDSDGANDGDGDSDNDNDNDDDEDDVMIY
ncbi:serine-aspartate repeat-containing protein C-like [Nilaparvata lugens]|uniref:serine-aspartate repeat-containing protein C-like n=1 Tax=Nilaparvata lugens TaxID=108931 RepID=UPI00193E7468|nr:serine-aspartate repeat-containing protein C-like [Nilaparvata lugens]